MKRKFEAVIVTFLVVATAFAITASAGEDSPAVQKMTPLENYLLAKAELDRQAELGIGPSNIDTDDTFTYADGPYPIYDDDGSPPGEPMHLPWGSHYVSLVMYSPPFGPGGPFGADASGGLGEFAGGSTHESNIGDQNGNGVLEWVAGFSYKTWGEDGIDNDGDGCIDEKNWEEWDGQVGCDMIPDQVSYYETGGLVSPGGDDGDLLANEDWYSGVQATEIWRAFVMEKWKAYRIRGIMYYPEWAGEHLSYYASESTNDVNANPEMDNDKSDWYVGNIDARGFPTSPPVNHACAAGYQLYMGITFKRDDDWVVTTFQLREYYDEKDWNGDGDTDDQVTAYYAIDPDTGKCRDNVVNTGVRGYMPTTSGLLITPTYTSESGDGRDWDNNGVSSGYKKLYHTVNSTWAMKGKVYTSYTFTAAVPAWGFGWWAIYEAHNTYLAFPLKFGGAFQKYLGSSQGYYNTFFFLTSDEDGNRHTKLPHYWVAVGSPVSTPGGACIHIYTREYYARYAGIRIIGGIADANGDGDWSDTVNSVFFPDKTGGGGEWLVEPTSKYAKGMYVNPLPYIAIGYPYFSSDGCDSEGLCILVFAYVESWLDDDANGDGVIDNSWYNTYYWFWITGSGFGIVPGSLKWVLTGESAAGGSVLGTLSVVNNGGPNIRINEDRGIENDKGFKMQGLSGRDSMGPDGVIEPGETATFYFVMVISAGAPIGPMDVKIIVSMGGVTQVETITLPIVTKLHGKEMSCFRHRQNALRMLRAFDMDDDGGMLRNLEPGDLVKVDDQLMTPEDAILLLISWFENGCGGGNDVKRAHSVAAGLTGKYGMGMQYWNLSPGQEEGNEGNGNGGLTGQDRKAVYGF